jgi:hypothetical protein
MEGPNAETIPEAGQSQPKGNDSGHNHSKVRNKG